MNLFSPKKKGVIGPVVCGGGGDGGVVVRITLLKNPCVVVEGAISGLFSAILGIWIFW